jgi:hypothetical protein
MTLKKTELYRGFNIFTEEIRNTGRSAVIRRDVVRRDVARQVRKVELTSRQVLPPLTPRRPAKPACLPGPHIDNATRPA